MSDFTQTMKDWKRMCGSFFYCHECPLGRCPSPPKSIWDTGKSFDDMEKAIDKWAAEHPEPQYPTWGEWLLKTYHIPSSRLFDQSIPADIAEKLGLEPKEKTYNEN